MATGTGNLPNDGMVFNPFDVLNAEEMNELVANIESLADGSGIGDGSITTAAIDDGAVTASKLGLSPQYIRQDNVGTTTSSTFTTSLSGSPGTNPSITLDLQVSSVMVIYGAQISNSSTGQLTRLGVDISGATTLAAETNGSLALRSPNTNAENISYTRVITGLTPGSNTFELAYATAGGTATYQYRFLTVIPIG